MGRAGEILDLLLRIAGGIGLPSFFIYLLRDKRKNDADTTVTESTVEAKIKSADISVLDATMIAVDKALKLERESKDEQIDTLREQLTEARGEVAVLRTRVQELMDEVAALRVQVNGST